MKLLFDENLPPRLPKLLADLYPGSLHIHQCGLGSSDDPAIWNYAKKNGLTIVSKDSDFQERSLLHGSPPKVIWLRTRNCTAAHIEFVLRAAFKVISRFIEEDQENCLALGRQERKFKVC